MNYIKILGIFCLGSFMACKNNLTPTSNPAIQSNSYAHLDLSSQNQQVDFKSSLHYAAEQRDLATVQNLLQLGVYINAKDPRKKNAITMCTALHLAIKKGYAAIVQELLKHSALELNLPDQYGNTALYHAVSNADEAIVKLLLSYC